MFGVTHGYPPVPSDDPRRPNPRRPCRNEKQKTPAHWSDAGRGGGDGNDSRVGVWLHKPTDSGRSSHALSQVWWGFDWTRVWSRALITCHGYKVTMLTIGDKPWQFELSCGDGSRRQRTNDDWLVKQLVCVVYICCEQLDYILIIPNYHKQMGLSGS